MINGIVLVACCKNCGEIGIHELNDKQVEQIAEYKKRGRSMGNLSDIFPDIPDWIAYGAVDPMAKGKTVCQKCQDADAKRRGLRR